MFELSKKSFCGITKMFFYRIEHLLKMKRRPVRRPIVSVNVKKLVMQLKKRNVSL
jgi:hypothetical protein